MQCPICCPYTAREHYFNNDTEMLFELRDGLFYKYQQMSGRISWFIATHQSVTELPDTAKFFSANKFGFLHYCKVPLTLLQADLNQEINHAAASAEIFEAYVNTQPDHV
eukprot:15337040-Ditylum_brightwellii.AAC.1